MADNEPAGQGVPPTAFTREYFLERAAAVQDQLRQQNPDLSTPELDLKLSSGWWEPAFDLSTILDVGASTLPLLFSPSIRRTTSSIPLCTSP